jgi:DNA-binding NarL/FixJ family response regulator
MKTILVIEDHPQMRRNLVTILEMEGYLALVAEHGHAGVQVARERLPDLILCDIMMPELDGYGVLQALRSDPATAGIPFIFLTAKGEKTDFRTGMNLGADDYLAKPVAKADLLSAISARLEREKLNERRIQEKLASVSFQPDFSSARPLEQGLNLSPREAEVLLWVAQGKSNADVGAILGMSEKTVKTHMGSIFQKLGLENRTAAVLRALEILTTPRA